MAAQEKRNNGKFTDAGNYYTAAANGWFMRFWYLPEDLPESNDIPANSIKYLARGVQDMLAAALCFRLTDSLDRYRNRCKQGVLFVEDIIEYDGLNETPRVGLLHEMIGDLKLFGEFDGYDDYYLRAAKQYSNVDSHRGWQAEPEFDSLIRTVVELAKSTNYGLDNRTEEKILHDSLTARIKYKREHFPSIVAEILEDGTWYSDTL